MKRIAVVPICCLILVSPAWASLKISVDGNADPPSPTLCCTGDAITLGIVGDGLTQSPKACWLLLSRAGAISGGEVVYTGSLSSYNDLEQAAQDLGMSKWDLLQGVTELSGYKYGGVTDLSFMVFADGKIPPAPLDGVLVDKIRYAQADWGLCYLTLMDEDLGSGIIYDTHIIFEPEPATAALLTIGWLGLLRKRRREHSEGVRL